MAFDASGSYTGGGGNSTWTHTIGAISSGIVVVGNGFWRNGGTITVGPGSVNWVTAAGTQSLTQVPNSPSRKDTSGFWTDQWYLINPNTGVGTFTSYGTSTNTTQRGASFSFSGVNQSTPIDVNGTTANTNNPIAGTLTTTQNSEFILDILMHASANNITAGANQTVVLNVNASGVTNGASYKAIASAGAGTVSWTSPGGDSAYSFLALKAITSTTTAVLPTRTLLGVGV